MLICFNFVLHTILTVLRENLWFHQKMHDFPTQNTSFHFSCRKLWRKMSPPSGSLILRQLPQHGKVSDELLWAGKCGGISNIEQVAQIHKVLLGPLFSLIANLSVLSRQLVIYINYTSANIRHKDEVILLT